MLIVLTYDVDRDHYIIKQKCLEGGFADCALMQGGDRLRLPNTTLLGQFDSLVDAVNRFRQLARAASRDVDIEKVFASPATGFVLTSDERC